MTSNRVTTKNPLKFVKQIYDTIHGSIGVTEVELKIIDSPIFQRLHRVMQLGPAYYVYPGATHSRFAHSLGAMHVMNQYLENVTIEEGPIVDPQQEDEWQKMRLVALLHDIGHYPFSHALEEPIFHEFNLHKHDEQSKRIIGGILKDRLGSYDPQEIIDIMGKKKMEDQRANTKSLLISSEFDVDKVDYLQRDSYHTGVAYGYVDVDRLLRTMEFDAEGKIIFNKPGPVIENFLFGRYHMYQAVYFHKTVTAFELMIERIYTLLVKEKKIDEPADLLCSDDEWRLSNFDDYSIWQKMFEYYQKNKDSPLGKMIGALYRRDPIRLAVHEVSSAEKGSQPDGYGRISAMKEFEQPRRKLIDEIKKQVSTMNDDELFFFTTPKPISILPDDAEIEIRKKESLVPLSQDNSLIFKHVGDHVLFDGRIYTESKLRDITYKSYQAIYKK